MRLAILAAEFRYVQRDRFPPGVAAQLKWYVYRLIDPRNGETFYVGKGQGDRVFQHVKGAVRASDDATDLKTNRLFAIRATGLDVGHVIHRHNIETEEIALQIEAALIDAYPGLTNEIGGHNSGDYGCRHVEQIIEEYSSDPFIVNQPLILISVGRTYPSDGLSVYDSVRAAWRINREKAERFDLVLAHRLGIVVGAFKPDRWMTATREHFPWMPSDFPDRSGFAGEVAAPEIAALYVKKRVPDRFRQRGAANPIRFVTEVDH
jgi:hypothetical protein